MCGSHFRSWVSNARNSMNNLSPPFTPPASPAQVPAERVQVGAARRHPLRQSAAPDCRRRAADCGPHQHQVSRAATHAAPGLTALLLSGLLRHTDLLACACCYVSSRVSASLAHHHCRYHVLFSQHELYHPEPAWARVLCPGACRGCEGAGTG